MVRRAFWATALSVTLLLGSEWFPLWALPSYQVARSLVSVPGALPPPMNQVGTAYDRASDRLMVFGGNNYGSLQNDVWVLVDAASPNPSWVRLSTSGSVPSAREAVALAYDEVTNRLIVHAGWPGLADTYVLTNANGLGGPPIWQRLPDGPRRRSGAAAAYDPATNRLIVFGGADVIGYTSIEELNDVWVLIDANGIGSPRWERLTPAGTAPSPRYYPASFYDSASNRFILRGGSGTGIQHSDLWALTNANGTGGAPEWLNLTPPSGPPALSGQMVGYDQARKRAVMAAGCTPTGMSSDVWVLDHADGTTGLPRWTAAAPSGPDYGGNCVAGAGYQPESGRFILALGASGGAYRNDVWHLDLTLADTEPPAVSAPSGIVAEATSAAGALVAFAISAEDDVDGTVQASCNIASGSLVPIGTHTVSCSAHDAAGNTSTVSFVVAVVDSAAPHLTAPATLTVDTDSPSGASVTVPASASDVVDGTVPVVCTPPAGSTLPVGTTPVACEATDHAGNRGTATVQVTVVLRALAPADFEVYFHDWNGARFEVYDEAGRLVRTIPFAWPNPIQPIVSHDHRTIVFASGTNGWDTAVWRLDVSTGQTRFLFNAPWSRVTGFLPGSDSTKVLASGSDGYIQLFDLVTETLSTWQDPDTLRASTPFNTYRHEVSFDALGRALVRAGYASAGGDALYLADLCAADATHHLCNLRVFANPGGGSSSWDRVAGASVLDPAGRYAFYSTFTSGVSAMWRRNLSTGLDTQLNVSTYETSQPKVFGERVLFTIPATGAYRALVTCDVETLVCRDLLRGGDNERDLRDFDVLAPRGPSDTIPPLITAPATLKLKTADPAGFVVHIPATATDLVDGTVPVTCNPPSGAMLPVGATTVTCEAVDQAGNRSTASVVVTVVPSIPPILEAIPDVSIEATSPAGAVVTFATSARDYKDGPVPVVCSRPSGSTFALGKATVGCTATDSDGNFATKSFSVRVVDTTPPIMESLPDLTFEAAEGSTVWLPPIAARAFDLVSGDIPVICSLPDGFRLPAGATVVACKAQDAAGNTMTDAFVVTVVWQRPD